MEKQEKVKLHQLNIICYVIFFILAVFLYYFFRNEYLLILCALLAVCPVITIRVAYGLAQGLTLKLKAQDKTLPVGEQTGVALWLNNPGRFIALEIGIDLIFSNDFYEDVSSLSVSMAAHAYGTEACFLPLESRTTGRYTVKAVKCLVQDMLGLVSFSTSPVAACDFTVIPKREEKAEDVDRSWQDGAVEARERSGVGNDSPEVEDIREYRPGDRLRDIHWKLSARQDGLMVKERSALSDTELCLTLDLPEEQREAELLLQQAYNICYEIIGQRIPVCLLCWNQGEGQFDEFRSGGIEELAGSFERLYEIPLTLRVQEDIDRYVNICYPETPVYWLLTCREGEVRIERKDYA